jgi:uncharacterized protein
MKLNDFIVVLFLALCFACTTSDKKEAFSFPNQDITNPNFPKPTGFINDFDSIFSDEQEVNLLQLVKKHEAATTNQIAVVTLTDIGTYDDLQQYSLDLSNYWGAGQKGKNNGVLIALYMKDKKIWIQNGSGIMNQLTNTETEDIITAVIIPEFKKGDYYTGLHTAIEAIIEELNSDN